MNIDEFQVLLHKFDLIFSLMRIKLLYEKQCIHVRMWIELDRTYGQRVELNIDSYLIQIKSKTCNLYLIYN